MSRSLSFVIDSDVDTRITVTEQADGSLLFEVEVLDTGLLGDLRAIFFDVGRDPSSILPEHISGADVTDSRVADNGVDTTGQDANVKGEVSKASEKFDVGVEFGTSGMSENDIQYTAFVIEGMSIDDISLQDFALRYTSVGAADGERNGSLKILGHATAAPDAVEDSFTTGEDTALAAGNVLVNDTDADGDALTVNLVDGAAANVGVPVTVISAGGRTGQVTIDADGAVSFDPSGSFDSLAVGETDTVTLTYGVTDSNGGADTSATVTVTVEGANDAPIITTATTDAAATGTVDEDGEDAPVTASGQLAATDVDNGAVLSWSVEGGGVGRLGSLTVDETGEWTYRLNNDNPVVQAMSQADSVEEQFLVTVTDEHGAADTRLVTVTVTGSDDGPVPDNSYQGTDGNDYFYGYPQNTEVSGLGGNDYLAGDAYYAYWDYDYGYYYDQENYWTSGTPVFGDDVIAAGPGHDQVFGDVVYGGIYGSENKSFVFGNDVISGDEDNDWLYGDSYYSYVYGDYWYGHTNNGSNSIESGDDVIAGNDGVDYISGDSYYFYVQNYYTTGSSVITAGDDTLSGGSEGDTINGDADWMAAYTYYHDASGSTAALGGHDILEGDDGNDVLRGDARYAESSGYRGSGVVSGGNDRLDGGAGDDHLFGDFEYVYIYGDTGRITGGDDTLEGGAGSDDLWGDFGSTYAWYGTGVIETGSDVFVFASGSGIDRIWDFEDGKDLIDVSGYGIADFAALSLSDDGSHTVIDFDGTGSNQVTVLNVVGLESTDFVFA